jgi:hypothetical protein
MRFRALAPPRSIVDATGLVIYFYIAELFLDVREKAAAAHTAASAAGAGAVVASVAASEARKATVKAAATVATTLGKAAPAVKAAKKRCGDSCRRRRRRASSMGKRGEACCGSLRVWHAGAGGRRLTQDVALRDVCCKASLAG